MRVQGDVVKELVSIKQQLHANTEVTHNWDQILREMTETVYSVVATCIAEQVPYYSEMPETKEDLKGYEGFVKAGEKVTLVYPQFDRPDMIFMRMRICDPSSGSLCNRYVPLANKSLTAHELTQLTEINSSLGKYFDGFHNPGLPDPLA